MFVEMAGGGGASPLDWMRNNEDRHSENFTQLMYRMGFLLTA